MTVNRLAIALCVFISGTVHAAPARIEAIRVAEYDDKTRIVLELDQPRSHKLLVLDNDPRVVVDLYSSKLDSELPQRGTGIVRALRHGRHQGDRLRVVFDLHASATATSVGYASGTSGLAYRIVVDIFPDKGRRQSAAGQQFSVAARNVLIAIDAGHGGKDPGAIGKGGLYEKTAVLGVSRRLAKMIDQEPGMTAMLTREGDYFLELRDRYSLAQQRNADLLVSVHADAVRDRRVRGASVYMLSDKASSDEARRLARRENASDLIGGIQLEGLSPDVADMIIDLSQNKSTWASKEVGEDVLSRLHGVGRVRKPAIQKAPFAVLKAPDIPSILVETAFISNPQEERLLRTRAHQDKLAGAILAGIRTYFYRNPLPGTLIAQRVDAGEQLQRQHVARRGDTLSGIAHQYKVSVPVLMRANNLPNDRLRVGQVLTIPSG